MSSYILVFVSLFLFFVTVSCHNVNVHVSVSDEQESLSDDDSSTVLQQDYENWMEGVLDSADFQIVDPSGMELDSITDSVPEYPYPIFSCGKSDDLASNLELFISQRPLQLPSTLTITVKGVLSSDVLSGTWKVHARFMDFNVKRHAAIPSEYLPLKKGKFVVRQVLQLPGTSYKGHVNATIIVKDQSKKQIVCFILPVDF